jgi:hypothetical protein
LLILGSCSKYIPTATPEPLSFQLGELLLETSSLPAGWRVSDRGSDFGYNQGQDEDRYIEFTTESFKSPTIHIIFLYRDEEYAVDKFKQYLPAHFDSAFRVTSWEVPSELNYQSEVADQFQFGCADFQNASDTSKQYTNCVVMGQYDRIVSVFSTYISPDAMSSYTDLEMVLQAIDKRMAEHLKKLFITFFGGREN